MHNDWKAALRDAVERKDVQVLARIPKTDLHCHGLLSAPLDTYAALLGRPLPPPPAVFGDFRKFADYIVTNLLPALAGPEPVRTLIRAAFERLLADGVVYAEMSFDLLVPEFVGLRAAEFADLLQEECARVADRLTVAPEIGIARGLPPDEVRPRLKDWLATGACWA